MELISESLKGGDLLSSKESWQQQAREVLFRDNIPSCSGETGYQSYLPSTTFELMEQELYDWLCDWDQ